MARSQLAAMEFYELEGSRETQESLDGDRAVLKIRCRWQDRVAIRNMLCPKGSPFFDLDYLVCTRITMKPVVPNGLPTGGATLLPFGAEYVEAHIEAQYEERRYHYPAADAGGYRQQWDISGEMLEVGKDRQWKLAGTPVDVSQSILMPRIEYQYEEFYDTPDILDNIESLFGKINSVTWRGKPAETMLYLGAQVSEVSGLDGGTVYQVRHRIIRRERSWNQQWRTRQPKRYPQGHPREGELMFDANGNQVYMEGVAGVAGWDETVPALYEKADFAEFIGE